MKILSLNNSTIVMQNFSEYLHWVALNLNCTCKNAGKVQSNLQDKIMPQVDVK